MSLATKLKKQGVKSIQKGPVWAGPESNSDNGGCTNSLLNLFFCCRERFRIRVVEGLKVKGGFNPRMEYGNMGHICEEAHAANEFYGGPLVNYAKKLCKDYPLAQEHIQHWYNVCKVQFPIYVKYWAKHKDVKARTPVAQEYKFHIPYKLPSGRTVYLRGKWDALDVIGTSKTKTLMLQENKYKGDIDSLKLTTQLRDDCQSMFYATSVKHSEYAAIAPFSGIRYNVIRRPLSGGKDSIRQKQGEEAEEFYARLGGLIADHPEHYFARWNVELAPSDIERFERRFFIPILEQLCDWWELMKFCNYNPWSIDYSSTTDLGGRWKSNTSLHWQTPHGIYNSLMESNSSEMDEYIFQGSLLGLTKTDNLFPELQ